jgi:hypothetical protein
MIRSTMRHFILRRALHLVETGSSSSFANCVCRLLFAAEIDQFPICRNATPASGFIEESSSINTEAHVCRWSLCSFAILPGSKRRWRACRPTRLRIANPPQSIEKGCNRMSTRFFLRCQRNGFSSVCSSLRSRKSLKCVWNTGAQRSTLSRYFKPVSGDPERPRLTSA